MISPLAPSAVEILFSRFFNEKKDYNGKRELHFLKMPEPFATEKNSKTLLILHLTSCHIHSNNSIFVREEFYTFESDLWKRLLKKANRAKVLF